MKNLETYLAPEVETVYYFSGKPLCAIDDPSDERGEGGIELPDDDLEQ